MFIKRLIIGLLSFYAFELRRNNLRGIQNPFSETQIVRIYESRKRQLKNKEKAYNNRKWKKKKSYLNPTFKLQGTNSKDIRFSNQKKLRRMFRNG